MIRRIFERIFPAHGGNEGSQISSVEELSLKVSGMRGEVIYELTENDGRAVLTLYRVTADEKLPEKTVACDTGEILDLLNSCGVIGWSGFHGKHPRSVLDGDMFVFCARVNGGVVIKAEGSARFPKGYRELVGGFVNLLASSD